MAKRYGCQFIETSAKQRIRIDETFYGIVRGVRQLNEEKEKEHYLFDMEKESIGCCQQCIIL